MKILKDTCNVSIQIKNEYILQLLYKWIENWIFLYLKNLSLMV